MARTQLRTASFVTAAMTIAASLAACVAGTAAAQTPRAVTVASFDDAGDWSASAGSVRARNGALEWRYDLSGDAVYVTTTTGTERMQGATAFLLRVRSDRPGELAFRVDQDGGTAFFTRIQVGSEWTDVRLEKEQVRHAFGFKKLDPDRIERVYLVDLSAKEHDWDGPRTVWIDSLAVLSTAAPAAAQPAAGAAAVARSDLARADSRSFYLAMTPWPYDFTPQAVSYTYGLIDEHADLVAHHFDEGVPWPEALEGRPWHEKIRENLDYRVKQLPGKKRYLALTPLSPGRDGLALHWTHEPNQKLPKEWKSKSFDDPEVVTAYVNYCRAMIEKFQPIYVNYGIESNILAERNGRAFPSYVKMTAEVYRRLKAEFPNLPLFLSFHIGSLEEDRSDQRKAIGQLLPYSDFVTVSTYPYGEKHRDKSGSYADPNELPKDWLRQVASLAPNKPFAVAETGFIAQKFEAKKLRIEVPGNERHQVEYVRWLLQEVQALNGEFVVWFVPRDYDAFWKRLEKMGMSEVFKTWQDTGLVDEAGNQRGALAVWDSWLALPRR
ncbi:MAG: hypothetical protein DCC71_04060 [Proteobacteria bacterium]|nr:MAG: hypothetical protein DCC71_04060 [Pseudomonadota bacterium]